MPLTALTLMRTMRPVDCVVESVDDAGIEVMSMDRWGMAAGAFWQLR